MADQTTVAPPTFVEWLAQVLQSSGRDLRRIEPLAADQLQKTNEMLLAAIPPTVLRATNDALHHALRKLTTTRDPRRVAAALTTDVSRRSEMEAENARLRELLREIELLCTSPADDQE